MMMGTALRSVLTACATAGVLAVAACSGSSTPAPTSSAPASGAAPSTVAPTDASAAAVLLRGKISVLVVQCFADHQLIPASALENGKNSSPRDDSSTWLHDGKVTENQYFGAWWSEPGSAVVVKGKTLADWASEIASSRSAWPSNICGTMPSVSS
jgi:hypothetical protein